MLTLLLAMLLAADKPPPARLVVPKSLQKQRAPLEKDQGPIPLASPATLEALGPIDPKPGAWVEYLVHHRGKLQARVKLTVLPEAAPEGRFWLELAAASGESLPSASRLLLKPGPFRLANVERAMVFLMGQAPFELPIEDVAEEAPPEPKPEASVVRQGSEQIKVRAGTFRAERISVREPKTRTTVWLARGAVPLWGLVRTEGGGRVVELVEFGQSGGKSVMPDPAAAQGKGNESVK